MGDLYRALAPAREQAAEILGLIQDEERARVRRWEEEKPSITSLVQSLTASCDIIKAERKKAKARLQELQAKIDKLNQAHQRQQRDAPQSQDVVDLQALLVDYNNRVLDTDIAIKAATADVAACQRPEEKEIYSTSLVALQDTKRLLQAEISGLRAAIMRLDAKSRLEAERQGAEDSGFTAVTRLDEQLVKTAARLNRAKQQLYFPESKGYRFSTGSSGVFFAAHDLFISELSGRFDFDLELVHRPEGKRVRIAVTLGGAAGEGDDAADAEPNSAGRSSGNGNAGPNPFSAGQAANRPLGRATRESSSLGGASSGGQGQGVESPAGTGARGQAASSGSSPDLAGGSAAGVGPRSEQTDMPDDITRRVAAAAAAAAAAATAAAVAAAGSQTPFAAAPPAIPSSTAAAAAPFAAMAAAAAAAKSMADAAAVSLRPPIPLPPVRANGQAAGAAGASPASGSGGTTPFAMLPPFPPHHKPQKGEMVASFFSGLSRRKDKLKEMLSGSDRGGAGAGPGPGPAGQSGWLGRRPSDGGRPSGEYSVPGTPSHQESGKTSSRLSKLAKVISNKADRLTDKISDRLRISSSRDREHHQRSHRPASPAATETFESVVTLDQVLGVGPDGGSDGGALEPAVAAMPASSPVLGRVTRDSASESVASGSPTAPDKPNEPWDNDSLGMEAFEARPSRRGIYLQLLGEQVEVVGERGTKMPDISMRELLLELEVSMTAVLEYNPLVGWQAPEKINLSIIQLNHKMRGSSLPLPSSIMRALLSLYLPGVLTSVLISVLPTELGAYVEASGEPVKASGELRVLGQQLATYVAAMAPVPSGREKARASARARSLLGLSDGQAQALSEIFGGRCNLLDKERPLSICELCRFYVKYSRSRMWGPLCKVWNKALQVCFDRHNVTERFTFDRFMDVAVARLARKPLRVSLTLSHLSAALNVDVGLATLRDFFERSVRELHKKAAEGGEEATLPREPIEVQLEMLSLWHASMSQLVRSFKSRFRSAGCSLLAHADHDVFQLGAEGVHYEGPLKVRVPMDVVVDPDNSLVWDIKLPDREKNDTSMLAMLNETLKCLAVAQPGEGEAAGDGLSGSGASANSLAQQIDQLLALGGPGAVNKSLINGLEVPVLQTAVVGQLSLRRAVFALKLDEERVAELLSTAAGEEAAKAGSSERGAAASASARDTNLAGQLLSCFGDLFTTSLDVGWRAEPEADGSNPCRCMLTVANSDVTRVRAEVDSLMFQSSVSPKLAVRMLYAVIANIILRFYSQDSFQLRFWYKLFSQLHEYLGKEALDVTACVSAHAEVVKPSSKLPASSGRHGTAASGSTAQVEPSLRVVINGGSSHQGLTQVAPFSLVNEINLLTVLESFKLFGSVPNPNS